VSEINPHYEQSWRDIFGHTARTGESQRLEIYAAPNDKWFNFIVFKPQGTHSDHTVAVVFQDVSERNRREANLAFLADITQDLSRLSTAEEVMETVGAKMGAFFNLSLCAFTDVDEASDEATITHNWHRDDVRSLVGTYRMSEFLSGEFGRLSRAGEASSCATRSKMGVLMRRSIAPSMSAPLFLLPSCAMANGFSIS
jgi:hypothetical protein